MLLIAEYIAPVNAIASIRWTKISKYLVLHHQASIDLLTNEKNFSGKKLLSENYSVDPTLMQDVSNFQKAYLVRDGAKLKIFHGIHNFLRYAKNINGRKIGRIERIVNSSHQRMDLAIHAAYCHVLEEV